MDFLTIQCEVKILKVSLQSIRLAKRLISVIRVLSWTYSIRSFGGSYPTSLKNAPGFNLHVTNFMGPSGALFHVFYAKVGKGHIVHASCFQ